MHPLGTPAPSTARSRSERSSNLACTVRGIPATILTTRSTHRCRSVGQRRAARCGCRPRAAARSAAPRRRARELVRRSTPERERPRARPRRAPWSPAPARPRPGTPSRSAWNCIRKRVARRPAVGAQHRRALGQRRRARRRPGTRSPRARPARGARAWCRGSGRRSGRGRPAPSAACRGRPARARSRRRRRRGDRAREGLALGGVCEQAEPVAQPLDRRAADEHRALERRTRASPAVAAAVASRPAGASGASPGCTSTKLPVPYVAFACAGREAGVAEQRRLLVAREARRSGASGRTASVSPTTPTSGTIARQQRAVDAEQGQQLVVPVAGAG